MTVKKILCKVRNRLFLNAIRSCVTEIVRKEIEPLKRMLSEKLTIQLHGGQLPALYTPTMVQKIDGVYFIIDCWHHRILYNKNMEEPIYMWKTLTDDIRGGHTIASDGELYLCDDTDYNAIRVFKKDGDRFKQTQIIGGIETRPHFVIYDKNTDRFFVLSSLGGILWIIKNESGQAAIERKVETAEIKDTYVRSFSLIDGFFYFISGNGFI